MSLAAAPAARPGTTSDGPPVVSATNMSAASGTPDNRRRGTPITPITMNNWRSARSAPPNQRSGRGARHDERQERAADTVSGGSREARQHQHGQQEPCGRLASVTHSMTACSCRAPTTLPVSSRPAANQHGDHRVGANAVRMGRPVLAIRVRVAAAMRSCGNSLARRPPHLDPRARVITARRWDTR